MQRVRGLISAAVIGVPLAVFVMISLHATREMATLIGFAVGLAIFAVVGTRSDSRDAAADAAWREAAWDLPPASDRLMLQRTQASMRGPAKQRRASGRPGDDQEDAQPSDTASQGSEPT